MWFWHISSKTKFINFAKAFLSIFKKSLQRCTILKPILLINARFESLNLSTIVIDFELIFENGNDIAFFDPPTFLWESCLRSTCKFYTPISYGYEFRQNQWKQIGFKSRSKRHFRTIIGDFFAKFNNIRLL